MKKIIPLKKQLNFKTNINEITSISLENTLNNKDYIVEGDLIISGTYKITETSTKVDNFEYKIPVTIEIDEKYIIDNIKIDINDFYYEVINNSILNVNIEIKLDDLIEKPQEPTENKEEQMYQEKIENRYIEETKDRCIEEETEELKPMIEKKQNIEKTEVEKKNVITEIFENIEDKEEQYSTYHIYIVREGDTPETIMTKYNTNKETLNEYNNISEINIGDKIIIPEKNDARNK